MALDFTKTTQTPSTLVISITCFDEKNVFDPGAQRIHFRKLADAGIGVYFGGGGSGEAYTLSKDEYKQLTQIAIEELKGKVSCRVMGVEPRSAEGMIELYELIKPFGVDGMQIYSLDMGHGRGIDPRLLETYFRDILDVVKDIPCILSSHQSVGYWIPVPMMKSLCDDYPQITGINATNPDIRYITQIRKELGDRVELHVGGPMQGLTCLSLGGQGYLSHEGNLVPKLCVSIIDLYKAGDMSACFDAFGHLLSVFDKIAPLGGAKTFLKELGLAGGLPRKPRLPVPEDRIPEVRQLIDELQIRAVEGIA